MSMRYLNVGTCSSMNGGNSAEEAYQLYAVSNWAGSPQNREKLRLRWLEAQSGELPSGPLGDEYRLKIRQMESSPDPGIQNLESKLLEHRYGFKADIGGQNCDYRNLLAALRNHEETPGIHSALLDETDKLIEGGFAELVAYRNQKVRDSGYEDYWSQKNSAYGKDLVTFLSELDDKMQNTASGGEGGAPTEAIPPTVSLETAVIFFCNLMFSEDAIPPVELNVRLGMNCPPGPPSVHPLSYRPRKGHLLGLDLPFVHGKSITSGSIGAFFHEMVHLFHFASVDARGGYAFPPELARDHLLYEVEAVGIQNLVTSAWKGIPYRPDRIMLKDLVYLAESERQLYKLASHSVSSIRDFVRSRIEEHYPQGDFMRTPLGATHLILENSAANYWLYPAAQWLGDRRIGDMLNGGEALSIPDFWCQGNEASYNMNTKSLFDVGNGFLDVDPVSNIRFTRPIGRNRWEKLRKQLDIKGYGALLA